MSSHDLILRLGRAQEQARRFGIDSILVTPGPDLRYLTGYQAIPLERLTCLVLKADGDPVIVVPGLERAAARASGVEDLGIEIVTWGETDDPYALTASLAGTGRIGLDNHMWAEKVLRLRAAMPDSEQVLAGEVLRQLRMRKSAQEVAFLREAGAAIDAVHRQVPQWLRAGRTEEEVGHDIAAAITAAGHATVDFVIVASGPNGASPHHEVSDRVIQPGDPVVVDIGGTMPSGYCSDSTRMYSVGEPPAEFSTYYAALMEAQEAGCQAARPGVPCEEVDRAARKVLSDAGYGDYFIHRTGHGIGLETHEDPYMVEGNTELLEPGMAFSVEPGVYMEGKHGARIEDILVCTQSGFERLNNTDRGLVVVDA